MDTIIGRILATAYLVLVILWAVAVYVLPAKAQHNHERGHNDYMGWSSGVTPNCCNNQDCGSLRADEVMQTTFGTSVWIDGEWCPVLPMHYARGRSPDWNTAHACISHSPAIQGCAKLLCFMGQGGF